MSVLKAKSLKLVRRPNGTLRVLTEIPKEEGRTIQSAKDECDVNYILRKYPQRVAMSHFDAYSASYGDVPAVDFHAAQEVIREAQDMFDALPGELRHRFHQDPGEFLAFVQDQNNADEMAELGLREPKTSTELERIAKATESLVAAAEQTSPEGASVAPAPEGGTQAPPT